MTHSTRLIAACTGALGVFAAAEALAASGGGHGGGMGGGAAGSHAGAMGAMSTHASGPTTTMTTSKPAVSTTASTKTQLGPTATGQPNQTCGSATAPLTPGAAAAAPGSAFNPDGKAGTVYAGQQTQNSKNTASVSQYDVACSHQK